MTIREMDNRTSDQLDYIERVNCSSPEALRDIAFELVGIIRSLQQRIRNLEKNAKE